MRARRASVRMGGGCTIASRAVEKGGAVSTSAGVRPAYSADRRWPPRYVRCILSSDGTVVPVAAGDARRRTRAARSSLTNTKHRHGARRRAGVYSGSRLSGDPCASRHGVRVSHSRPRRAATHSRRIGVCRWAVGGHAQPDARLRRVSKHALHAPSPWSPSREHGAGDQLRSGTQGASACHAPRRSAGYAGVLQSPVSVRR